MEIKKVIIYDIFHPFVNFWPLKYDFILPKILLNHREATISYEIFISSNFSRQSLFLEDAAHKAILLWENSDKNCPNFFNVPL